MNEDGHSSALVRFFSHPCLVRPTFTTLLEWRLAWQAVHSASARTPFSVSRVILGGDQRATLDAICSKDHAFGFDSASLDETTKRQEKCDGLSEPLLASRTDN